MPAPIDIAAKNIPRQTEINKKAINLWGTGRIILTGERVSLP